MRDGMELTAGMKRSLFTQPQKMALKLTDHLRRGSKVTGSEEAHSERKKVKSQTTKQK